MTQERHSMDAAGLQVLKMSASGASGANNNSSSSSSNSSSNNNNGKARSQTVNGKPLALDVSSLIGKPSTSSASANADEAPLNLSMKTKEETNSSSTVITVDSLPLGSVMAIQGDAVAASASSVCAAVDVAIAAADSAESFPLHSASSTSSPSTSNPLIHPALTQQRPSSRVISHLGLCVSSLLSSLLVP